MFLPVETHDSDAVWVPADEDLRGAVRVLVRNHGLRDWDVGLRRRQHLGSGDLDGHEAGLPIAAASEDRAGDPDQGDDAQDREECVPDVFPSGPCAGLRAGLRGGGWSACGCRCTGGSSGSGSDSGGGQTREGCRSVAVPGGRDSGDVELCVDFHGVFVF